MTATNSLSPYVITETLDEASGGTLLRAVLADGHPAILKVLDPRRSRADDIDRLQHEYAIGKTLEGDCALRPLAIDTYEGSPALVMEGFGGESLDRLLRGGMGEGSPACPGGAATMSRAPVRIECFLDLAVRIAAAVAELHRQGVIHKDIKPQSILVGPTGEVKLANFGIASRLPREQAPPQSPRQIAGSLPYMSPEQTGRMNRTVDSRTDLYALGVTFYQMLTGRLPFDARDPLEWIHAHLARTPPSPSEVVPEVPEQITRIVMKLLAKMAEDRYQSARGLVHDLARCIEQWSARGAMDLFPLGERDVLDRLQIPQKLYGRGEEIAMLLRTFDRVVGTGTPELLLVSGYSGIGKSSIVYELQKPVVRERGIFLSCKFDQYSRESPYATIIQSFTTLVRDLLTEPPEHLEGARRALREALGVNGKLIVDMIPPVGILLGEQPPAPELPMAEAERRLRRVFRRFVGVFARREQPLVLFLDDLQWADAGSLRLIEDMITDPDTHHLLLIGAYRDNEVTASHPLMLALERIRKTPAIVSGLVLCPLHLEHVVKLVADTTRTDPERARPLAALVYEKTGGNPFFVHQFLRTLDLEGLLELDEERLTWRWDIARIQAKGYTDNVVDFMVRKLGGLPARAQEILKTAAAIGSKAEAAMLALALQEPEEDISRALGDALQEGLIDHRRDAYAFAHDRVQQAAYLLLPEVRRSELHLRIGRLLVSHTDPGKLDERIFDIVTQLNSGAALITQQEERTQVAELNLRAARKAKAAAAYRAAVGYLVAGASLLHERAWERQYELMFALMVERAECESLSGGFEEAERLFPVLLRYARSRVDKAVVYRVMLDTHTTTGEDAKAIDNALECLRMFGIDIPAHPSSAEVDEAYQEVWRSLGGRRIEGLIDLPLMTDPEMQAAMEILARLYAPAYHWDNNLLYLHVCHGVSISLRYGNSAASTQAYGWFGLVLAARFHRFQEGHRFATLAFDLMERHGFLAYKAKANFQMRIISYWTQPLDTMLDYSRAAFDAAVETGDMPVACFSCYHTVLGMVIRGDHLPEVQREAERAIDFVRRAGFRDVQDMIVGVERFVQAMRGGTRHLSTYDDGRFSEAEFERDLAGDRMPTLSFYHYAVKLMARFLSGDHDAAFAASEKCKGLLWAGLISAHGHYFYLYHALTLAAVFDELSPEQQEEAFGVLDAHLGELRRSAETYPPTFHNAYALVSAEIARIRGQNEEAMRLYDDAIRSASESGLVQNEALAHELASRYYRARGFDLIAGAYLREARARYARWGADGKVKQLERQSPGLVEERPLTPANTVLVSAEHLDVRSVVKASQTISSEIVLGKLVRTLLDVVLEQAGAQRGCLILARNGGLFIEAEAAVDEAGVATKLLEARPVSSSLVPVSIVNYVVRTKERVVLDDAARASTYSSDPYVVRVRPRSLLGLPILRQGEVVGLLYLENNLITGAFTPERLAALSLLASQAAISLENALLLSKEKAARMARDEFLSVAAHELNTPLTSLLLALQAMARSIQSGRSLDPQALGGLVERAVRQGARLARLNKDLLDVSRIHTHRLPLDLEDVDLGALARDVVEQLKPALALARCSVSIRADSGVVGRWDRSHVERILTNLLSNAIKFGAGKPIEISVSAESGIARLAVRDHGIGIDAAGQSRIFERFERAVSERHYGGLGLGLYISRSIAEEHGGSIHVESQPGAGATFTVELPCAGPREGG